MKSTLVLAVAAFVFAGAVAAAQYQEPKDSFGAIAGSREAGGVGTSVNWPTADDAARQALEQCEVNSRGKVCQVRVTFKNACGAVAQSGNKHAGYAWGDTPEKAQQEAVNSCQMAARAQCAVTHSFCSKDRPLTRAAQ